MFNFFSKVTELATGLGDSVKRFANQDYLDALIAGCYLIARADGNIDSDEKKKTIQVIEKQIPGVFANADIIKSWSGLDDEFDFDEGMGEDAVAKRLKKVSDPEGKETIGRMCAVIGRADGDFDDQEKAKAKQVAIMLGLKPEQFGL